ncbi:outer membrane protein assembly factor BamA [Cognatishimia sp. 1_MG-2023]|uniref:outer membrane protein assembly factor BamA n=1 Tax=Cognatishimia sp. 1_MG-2023 TaxID=3062642 RepID=UPI0026E124F7|nr:outer membrane protein assembly factor BamA [Cognatishimia sp. 1_MG-2023]MDO6725502.1 outer membrane protein assembly factor BamA [Cognatishimia sp. 1_MG-2023]
MSEHIWGTPRAGKQHKALLRRTAFAFSVLISLGIAGTPDVAQAQSYRFSTLAIEGNNRIEDAAIASYAGIGRGQVVSAGELNDAYQRILGSGLFETVEITPRGNRLVIKVVEFPTINVIRFEGNKRLKDEVLEAIVESQSRRVLNPAAAERDAIAIAEAYAESGRVAARVTPRVIRRSDNRADLVFEIFEGALAEIERLSFVGNRVYSDRRLRRVLGTKQAGVLRALVKRDTLVEDRIEFDKQVITDFYQSRGYVDFRVTGVNAELARERDGYFLTFNVEEGQQFSFGEVTAVSELPNVDAELFQDELKIRSGVTYSPSLVESSIARLERLAIREGLDFVRVEPRITRNDRDLTLDVEFALVRGPRVFVERIDVEGNTTTLDRVVRRQFKVAEGDPFNPREIRESAERIRALGFFATAEVNAREGSSPDQVIVDVDVEERPTGSLNFGGTYSTDSGFGLVAGLTERNFLGRGQQLSFSLSTSPDVNNYEFRFVEPAFIGRDVAVGFSASYRDLTFSQVRYENTVGQIQPFMSFATGENSRLQLRYTYESVDMSIAATDVIAGSLLDAEAARGEEASSSIGYTYTYDTRIGGLNPDAGFLLEFGQDYAGAGGDIEYLRTTAKAVAQTKVFNGDVTLRASLEGGLLYTPNNDSRANHRFALGGSQMRGFEPYGIGPREQGGGIDEGLGGKYFAVARFEAEFPLGLPEEYGISGGVFYDVGSLWGVDGTAGAGSLLYNDASLRHVVGVSLFWETPIGPLQFNFSKALQKEAFDREQNFNLTIRTEF